jgi:ornithine decarboxylase
MIANQPIHIKNEFTDADIREMSPCVPVSILKPSNATLMAAEFIDAFSGTVMYAVKCNPDPLILNALYDGGITHFDVASIGEIRIVKGLLPHSTLYFMHPIKGPEVITEAYNQHDVRAFVLDYKDELDKILKATDNAKDLELFVRIVIPKDQNSADVATDFASKFGAKHNEAIELLKACRPFCKKLGVSFHVGSQCLDPLLYEQATSYAAKLIKTSKVQIDVLDIGGGFPAALDIKQETPPIKDFMLAVDKSLAKENLTGFELLCEAGRGLVADSGSLLVRVECRKGDLLYINDGTYGGITEASGSIKLPYPCHLTTHDERPCSDNIAPFRLTGPTCDSVDMMQGPFWLPENVQTGDWITLDQLGAYGETCRSSFNSFNDIKNVLIE